MHGPTRGPVFLLDDTRKIESSAAKFKNGGNLRSKGWDVMKENVSQAEVDWLIGRMINRSAD